jgi:hypothetical protein
MSVENRKDLEKIFYDDCSKLIKGRYPCTSCFGCENRVKDVMVWLESWRPESDELLSSLHAQPTAEAKI